MLACRICRVALSAETGCAVCLAIKPNLVQVGDDEDERPSLAEVSSETVAMLRKQIRVCRHTLDTARADTLADVMAIAEVNKHALACANSVAKVLESARKLQNDGVSAIQAMSFIERAELFISWYAALPPPYRKNVRDQQEKHELAMARPLSLPAGDL